jgi:Acetyltransferase (GNAT) domain
MKIIVRQAHLEADKNLIVDTLYRNLTPLSDSRRFHWLYRNNPYAPPRVWFAIDADKSAVVGMASAFPRRIYVEGREVLGWVLGDFCINDQYRSLGPALQLQRACLAEVDSRTMAFCYDFPSSSMMAIYRRLGIQSCGRMVRLALPLRVDRKIGQFVKNAAVVRGLSVAGNLLMALSKPKPSDSRTLTVSPHSGNCGEEFSILARKMASRHGVCLQRSAEYLNWRYVSNPLYRYELLTARREGSLTAYAVFTHIGEDATLVDLFGDEAPSAISGLVSRVVDLLRERGVVTVSVPISESHPWLPLLQGLGFKPRETSPVVVYAPYFPSEHSLIEGITWFLMHGDRDS